MKYMAVSAGVVLVLAGCSALVPPQAWETGALAKPEMSMAGDALAQHDALHVSGGAQDVRRAEALVAATERLRPGRVGADVVQPGASKTF